MPAKTRPCLKCGTQLPVPMDVCLRCGGAALYSLPDDGEWGVDIGPVTSRQFREETLDALVKLLDDFNRRDADEVLATERVRVASSLSREAAEALVEALGKQKTAGRIEQGPARVKGMGAGAALVAIGAVITGVVAIFASWPVTLVLAGAVIGGGAFSYSRGKAAIPTVGRAPIRPTLPHNVADAPKRLREVRDKIPAEALEDLTTVVEMGFRIVGRVTDPEDLVSIGADGIDGGMGQGALGLIRESVRVAELLVRDGADETRLKALDDMATTAKQAMAAIDKLEQTISQRPMTGSADLVQEETEMLHATVRELEKVR